MAFAWNASARKAIIASHYRPERRICGGFHYDNAPSRRKLVAQFPTFRNIRANSLNKQIENIVKLFQETASIENRKRRYASTELKEGNIKEI